MSPDPWTPVEGRDLEVLRGENEPHPWGRVVACLNIWQDLAELRANLDTWFPYVDHVIAVDGAYAGMPRTRVPYSTDGTVEFLEGLDHVELVRADRFWPTQVEKRTEYLSRGQEGDLLVRIDADERFRGMEHIRRTPFLDVGWAQYTAPIYRRRQGIPIAFRWVPGLSYVSRHHWVRFPDGTVNTQQLGAPGKLHRLLPVTLVNSRGGRRPGDRQKVALLHRRTQAQAERRAAPELVIRGHEPLRILQWGPIDPGATVFRLHTAINTTSPHDSAMAVERADYLQAPRQYDPRLQSRELRAMAQAADLLHFHVSLTGLRVLRLGAKHPPIVMHHHGTRLRRYPKEAAKADRALAALRLVSNLELLQYDLGAGPLHYLPNPIPVARYRRYADRSPAPPTWGRGPFRVAHSPTKRAIKGTDEFLAACARLHKRGIRVEPVLIQRQPLARSLELKATCHACFDSFFLGLQNSGLEAAAMGRPVVAGDPDVKREAELRWGRVPWVWANDGRGLEEALERLATDQTFYQEAGDSVRNHVLQHHDYARVVETYLDLLDGAIHWRAGLALGKG